MPSKALRPEQLQFLLTALETDFKQLIVAHRNQWRSAKDRESTRQTLIGSITKAREAAQSVKGATDPESRLLARKLLLQVELASDGCEHPESLRL